MHYYQFNIGDYARRTAHLTPIENLAYRLLLERYYLTEKPLELDIKKLSRLIGLRDNPEEVEQVLDDFFDKTDEGWKNNRCEEEIAKYHSKSSASRANGKLGGRPKNQEKTQQVFSENQDETKPKGNQEPRTNNQEPILKDNDQQVDLDNLILESEFDRFWKSGIRKIGKKQAKSAFKKILKAKHQKIEFTDYLVKDIQWRLANNQLGFSEMHPTTYLRNERWTDERRQQPKQSASHSGGRPSIAERAAQQTEIIQARIASGEFDQRPMGQDDAAIPRQVDIGGGRKARSLWAESGAVDAELSPVVPQNGEFDK